MLPRPKARMRTGKSGAAEADTHEEMAGMGASEMSEVYNVKLLLYTCFLLCVVNVQVDIFM